MNYAPLTTFDLSDLRMLGELGDPKECCQFIMDVATKYLSENDFVYLQQEYENLRGVEVARLLGVSEAYVCKRRRAVAKIVRAYVWFALHETQIARAMRTAHMPKLEQDIIMNLVRTRNTQEALAKKLNVTQQCISQHFVSANEALKTSTDPMLRDFASFLSVILYKRAQWPDDREKIAAWGRE